VHRAKIATKLGVHGLSKIIGIALAARWPQSASGGPPDARTRRDTPDCRPGDAEAANGSRRPRAVEAAAGPSTARAAPALASPHPSRVDRIWYRP
jgi:hypothetical protein